MAVRSKKRWWIATCIMLVIMVVACVGVASLVLTKRLKMNEWFSDQYSVSGIDVAHYQGAIDWDRMESQGVDFAFIKATEGSSHVDSRFKENWEGVNDTDVLAGAYHFFSFDSAAETQAQLYIDTVGGLYGNLPPVIDVEYYGDKAVNPPEKEALVSSLSEMLTILEEEYQVKPIIYTTYSVYFRYLKGNFDEYPLWIRNVYFEPGIEIGRDWMFWQHSDTAVMDGYGDGGTEKYIDKNVFAGSFNELFSLLVYQEEADPLPEVVMKVEPEMVSQKGVTLVLRNESEKIFMYGSSYYLQRKNDGCWKPVEMIVEEAFFHTIGYHLNGSEEKEITIDWSTLYGKLEPGQYRIVKDISEQDAYGFWEDYKLCVEFRVH